MMSDNAAKFLGTMLIICTLYIGLMIMSAGSDIKEGLQYHADYLDRIKCR